MALTKLATWLYVFGDVTWMSDPSIVDTFIATLSVYVTLKVCVVPPLVVTFEALSDA